MPKQFRFRFWPGRDPFMTEWPELPTDSFSSAEEARSAAEKFVAQWSAGGYAVEDDSYWARETVGDMHRTTQFVIDGVR